MSTCLNIANPVPDVKVSLPFLNASEFIDKEGGEPDWILKPLLAVGAMTEIDGKAKGGKTSFVLAMIRSIVTDTSFLNFEVKGCPVVWLTEERGVTFCRALHRVALGYERNLFILEWHETFGMPWPEIVDQAVAQCKMVGAKVLVIDTFPQFAKLLGDKESQSGAMLEALHPIQKAASTGLCIILSRHDRKSGGEVGDSGRGSTAFAGAMDVIMAIRKPGSKSKTDTRNATPIREIHIIGRFEELPSKLTVRWTGGEYDLLDVESPNTEGEDASTEDQSNVSWSSVSKILEHLPLCDQEAVTIGELKDKCGLGEGTVRRALAQVDRDHQLKKLGKGTSADPRKYYRVKPAGCK